MLRVGIIGCGEIARKHMEAYMKIPELAVVAFYDLDPVLAERMAEDFHIPRYPFEELLSLADIIDICTPLSLRVNILRLAIAKGKNCICETPMTNAIEELQEIILLSREKGVRIFPLHLRGLSGPLAKIREIVERKPAVKKGMIRINRLEELTDNRIGIQKGEKRPVPELDLLLDDITFLNKNIAQVIRVYAMSAMRHRDNDGVYILASLRLANGTIAHLNANRLRRNSMVSSKRLEVEFAYPGGLMDYKTETGSPLRFLFEGSDGCQEIFESPVSPDSYEKALREISWVHVNGGDASFTLKDSYQALKITLAVLESAATGKVIQFKPAGGESKW